MASLLILKGPNQGMRIPLNQDKIVMGRHSDCDVVINVPAVSREHARIIRTNGKYFVEDLKSRNGTLVNGQAIETEKLHPLFDNDQIKICDFICSFHELERKPLPAELARETQENQETEGSSTVEASISTSSSLVVEQQSAERLRAILDIMGKLVGTLQLDELLPKIVDRLFELFRQADRGFIILKEEPSGRLIPRVIKTRRPQDEANARFSKSIVKMCLERGEGFLCDDAASDSRFSLSQSIADFRIRSVMCAPLIGQDGKAYGVIQLDTQDRSKKFHPDDLSLLVGVGNQAAIAVDYAKRHEEQLARDRIRRDLELAQQMQLSFLPRVLPNVPGYECFAHYEAALEVGGDYYNIEPLADQRIAVTVADVAGKGVPAALLMAKLSSDARFCLHTAVSPSMAVSKLNDLLVPQTSQNDRFVTFASMVLDPRQHQVTLVSAGHQSPLLYRSSRDSLEEAMPTEVIGLPLGVCESAQYEAWQVQLEPGDFLLCFTDGVTDAKDKQGRQFQTSGIYEALRLRPSGPREAGERLIKAVKLHSAGCPQYDDITVVCFGRASNF